MKVWNVNVFGAYFPAFWGFMWYLRELQRNSDTQSPNFKNTLGLQQKNILKATSSLQNVLVILFLGSPCVFSPWSDGTSCTQWAEPTLHEVCRRHDWNLLPHVFSDAGRSQSRDCILQHGRRKVSRYYCQGMKKGSSIFAKLARVLSVTLPWPMKHLSEWQVCTH